MKILCNAGLNEQNIPNLHVKVHIRLTLLPCIFFTIHVVLISNALQAGLC